MATIKSPIVPPRAVSSGGGFGRILRPLLGLVVLLLVAAASIAGTWFYLHWQNGKELNPLQMGVGTPGQPQQPVPTAFTAAPSAPVAVPSPIFIPLQPFTVTLEDEASERILHLGITLRVNEEQSRSRIEKYLPEVRSRILMLLSSLSPQAVRTQEGRTELAKSIATVVNKPFSPLPDGQFVTDVLFTEFVVQ